MGNLSPDNVRLTKYHRESIAKKVLNYKFQNSNNQLLSIETEHKNLAQAVYDSLFSTKQRELMSSLPSGWMYETSSIKSRLGGMVGSLEFSGSLFGLYRTDYSLLTQMGYSRASEKNMRVPYDQRCSVVGTFGHEHPITERYNALINRFHTVIEEARKSKSLLDSALKSVTTTNALINGWPEVEPFVKQVIGSRSAPSTALQVPVATLNATFGLPVPA